MSEHKAKRSTGTVALVSTHQPRRVAEMLGRACWWDQHRLGACPIHTGPLATTYGIATH